MQPVYILSLLTHIHTHTHLDVYCNNLSFDLTGGESVCDFPPVSVSGFVSVAGVQLLLL